MIREAIESDCVNLTALSIEVWLQTYSRDGIRADTSKYVLSAFTEEYFKNTIADPKYRLLVFTEDIYLRGYALINVESQFMGRNLGFEIEKLYVRNSCQRQGVGRALLSELIARYGSKFWLYTWVNNESIAFYKKLGLKEIGQYDFKFGDETIENLVFAHE